jgi:hypothetical protein
MSMMTIRQRISPDSEVRGADCIVVIDLSFWDFCVAGWSSQRVLGSITMA